MTVTQQGTIDFTVMYATHHAFRRDLARLSTAAAVGRANSPGIHAGWQNFRKQLLLHHSVEDAHLWPRLQQAVQGRPRDLALLAEMEAEHAHLDPLLERVDTALVQGSADLGKRVGELSRVLCDHLEHEEKEALPLIEEVLTPKDWQRFRSAMGRRQGPRGAAIYVPWVTDGIPAEGRVAFLDAMPSPIRALNRLFWESRYHSRKWWRY